MILSVPCCQRELNKAPDGQRLLPERPLQYGLDREAIAATYTPRNALQAEIPGKARLSDSDLEFIDMEHLRKNILIRAVKQGGPETMGKDPRISAVFGTDGAGRGCSGKAETGWNYGNQAGIFSLTVV